MQQSPSIIELTKALVEVQSKLKAVKKGEENPFFHSKYADLTAIWELIRKPLSDSGLAIIQTTDAENGISILETMLAHTSGEWIKGRLLLNPIKNDPQGMGSAITYARRYALAAIIGITAEDEDDDAEGAMAREQKEETISNNQLKAIYGEAKRLGLTSITKDGKSQTISAEVAGWVGQAFGKGRLSLLTLKEADTLIQALRDGKIKAKPKADNPIVEELVKQGGVVSGVPKLTKPEVK